MRDILLTVPSPLLVLLIVGGSALLTVAATHWVRTHFDEKVHQANNEVAGFIFSAVAVMYGVLLAFMVLVVWQAFQDAEVAVEHETNSLVNIYRIAQELEEPFRSQVRGLTRDYARDVIDQEWLAMTTGDSSPKVQETIEKLWLVHRELHSSAVGTELHQTQMFDSLAELSNFRRVRLLDSRQDIPGLLWMLLISGAIVTIGFTLFFRAPNWGAHLLMGAFFAGLVAFVLLLIVELDNPFAGDVKVEPTSFYQALDTFTRLGGN